MIVTDLDFVEDLVILNAKAFPLILLSENHWLGALVINSGKSGAKSCIKK